MAQSRVPLDVEKGLIPRYRYSVYWYACIFPLYNVSFISTWRTLRPVENIKRHCIDRREKQWINHENGSLRYSARSSLCGGDIKYTCYEYIYWSTDFSQSLPSGDIDVHISWWFLSNVRGLSGINRANAGQAQNNNKWKHRLLRITNINRCELKKNNTTWIINIRYALREQNTLA